MWSIWGRKLFKKSVAIKVQQNLPLILLLNEDINSDFRRELCNESISDSVLLKITLRKSHFCRQVIRLIVFNLIL